MRPGLDQIEALAPEREALWTRLEKASFLTDDEKRTAAGYGPKRILKFNPNHDDRGRFDFSPDGATPVAGKLPGGRLPPFKLPKTPELKPPKVPPPPNPPGMVRNDLGKVWGRRPGDTKAMADALDKAKVEQLQAGGFTRELAQQWQNLYSNELVRNPANQAASARLQFLKRFLELSK